PYMLEGTYYSLARYEMAGQPLDLLTLVADGAAARAVEASQAVEDCGLARAVRSYDGDDLPPVDIQLDAVDCEQSTKAHRQIRDFQQLVLFRAHFCSSR